MLNFDSVDDLVSHMFEKLEGDEPVSVVANKDLSLSIIKELLEYNNVILKYANIDDYGYDRGYIVTLRDDIDTDNWNIAIEPIYNYEKKMYFGTDGYVLFHEDVNSKALIDMQNNKNVEMSEHDLFVINNSDEEDDVNSNANLEASGENDESNYQIVFEYNFDKHATEKMYSCMELMRNFFPLQPLWFR